MDGDNLGGIYSVAGDDDVACEVTHGHNFIGHLHTPLLDSEDAGVDVVHASAVEGGGVNVDHKGLSGEFLGGDAGVICEPVVGVDYVKLVLSLHCDRAAHHGVAGDLFHEVGAVLARELEFLAITDGEVLYLTAFFFFYQTAEFLRVCVRDHVGTDVDELDLVKELIHGFRHGIYGNVRGVYDGCGALVFISGGRRHYKEGFYAVVGEALHNAFTSSTETACDVGRKLPSKH